MIGGGKATLWQHSKWLGLFLHNNLDSRALQPCYQRTPGSCLSATPASLPAVVKAVSSCILAKSFFFYLRQNRYLLQMAAVMRIKYDKACEHFAEWLGENKCSRSVSQETLRSVVCGNLQSWSGECTEIEPF